MPIRCTVDECNCGEPFDTMALLGRHLEKAAKSSAKRAGGRIRGVASKGARTYKKVAYDSKTESDRARELDIGFAGGVIRMWIRQPKFLDLGCPLNTYRPDFLVINSANRVWVEDVKGFETPEFKRAKRLWVDYGPIPLHVLKRRAGGWDVEIVQGGRDLMKGGHDDAQSETPGRRGSDDRRDAAGQAGG